MSGGESLPSNRRFGRWAMAVVWPSFLMAGAMEMLVFALVDPSDLSWFGGERLALSRQAVYTIGFLLFWLVISVGASLSLLLFSKPESPENQARRGDPR